LVLFLGVIQAGCQESAAPPAKPKVVPKAGMDKKPIAVKPAEQPAAKPTDAAKSEEPVAEKPIEAKSTEAKPLETKPSETKVAGPSVAKAAGMKPGATSSPPGETMIEDKPAEKPAPKTAERPAEKSSLAGLVAVVPKGLPPLHIPADNAMTAEKVELGKMLYFDKRLSKDGTVACVSCHDPKMGWAEHTPTSTGIGKQVGGRNAPSVVNAAYAVSQFWDGRAPSLEAQALGPIENPIEMGHKLDDLVPQLDKISGYHDRFQQVFHTPVTKEGIGKAIAAFERTVLSGDSAYDRFKAGDEKALDDAQKRGMKLFETAGCAECHTPPMFTTYEFHNAGVDIDKPKPDEGRKAVTKRDEDLGAFRAPSLRDVAQTSPYFHDGSAKTLDEAVALMAAGGKDNPHRDTDFDSVRKAKLTVENRKDLVAFLKALSGKTPIIDPPALP
jgi:cytochrome c peroxidase